MSTPESEARQTGFAAPPRSSLSSSQFLYAPTFPLELDWRKTPNAVTPVKDQGACGSSYAFASLAALESRYYIQFEQVYDLSEQEIVDCAAGAFDKFG